MSSLDTSWITARALAQPQPGRMSGQANAAHASHHETSRRHETSPGNEADDLRVRVLGPIDSGTNFVHAELTRAFAAAPRLRICSGGVARERAAPRTTCAPFVWKHTPPWRLRLSAAADRDFVFAMARDPLAWFVSVRKAPYILALNASAPLAGRCTLERKRTGDPLSPYSETFASLAEAWNSYYAGYAALRVPLVRYEDLVLRHGPTMDNLTAAARAHGRAAARARPPPRPTGDAPASTAAAKSHGSSRDWFEAREHVAAEAWLGAYSAANLSWACAALNASLLRHLDYATCLEPEAAREKRRRAATERVRRRSSEPSWPSV